MLGPSLSFGARRSPINLQATIFLPATARRLIPLADASGPDFDKGELQRYLAELAWCPYAVLNNNDLVFEPVDGYASSHVRLLESRTLCKEPWRLEQNRSCSAIGYVSHGRPLSDIAD